MPEPLPQTPHSSLPQYDVEPGVVARDGQEAVHVWATSGFGQGMDAVERARYGWFYADNPQGRSDISFLRADGAAVGFLGIGARAWVVDDEQIDAGVLVDFVVHPRHRSAAPALMLQRQSRARAAARLAMLYGLPDTKAVAIFKRLGSQFTCELPRYVRVLRSRTYLKRFLPAWLAAGVAVVTDLLDFWGMRLQLLLGRSLKGAWIEGFDERFDVLWRSCVKSGRSVGVRDRNFLRWRFEHQPGHRYRVYAICERGAAQLCTYFVCELVDDTLIVKDVLSVGSPTQFRKSLLMLALAARGLGAAAVFIQIVGEPFVAVALRKAQFIERDRRPFFVSISDAWRERFAGTRWYITQADEDI